MNPQECVWEIRYRMVIKTILQEKEKIHYSITTWFTNWIAERAVRRVKEGTSAVLLQSGLDEQWWADSVEYKTYLRNVQDLLSDGKTPHEWRFGMSFNGPVIPFGAMVEYHPISAKDISRLHQFGPRVLTGIEQTIPIKYIDVTRTTHTSLDVLLEKHIDDFWNVHGGRELSDAWTGFTRFILLNERPPDGYTSSGWRHTRKQTTSRPDNVWPEMWKHMSDAAKSKAKQKWAIEKPKLDNARRLRSIFFIEPNDDLSTP